MGISEKLTYLNETKDLIKQAIVNKGVEVSDEDTFRSYANKISTIEGTGGGVEDLTEELTEQDNLLTVQETTIEDIINALENKSAGGGIDTSDATATSFDIARGKTAYVNGEKIEGLIPVVEEGGFIECSQTMEPERVYQVFDQIGEGWDIFNGLAVECPVYGYYIIKDDVFVKAMVSEDLVAEALNLTSDKIAEGINLLGIQGTFKGGTNTSDATATSGDLLLGKTAYVNDEKIEGTIETYDGAMSDGAEVENSLVDFLNNEKTHYTKKDLEGATSIKHYMWYQNNTIISVDLPDSVLSLEQRAFSVCANLERVTLPKNLKTIGNYCFHTSPKITEVILPDTLTLIGNAAFQGTAITTITIPDGVNRGQGSMFADCTNLVSADMGRVTLTGQSCFQNCTNLKDVQLGNYIDFVSDSTFKNCTSLETIKFPATVTTISTNVFNGCTSLMEVICLAPNPPKLSANSFDGVPENCLIKVPAGSVEAYRTATNWSVRADYIVAYEEV